MGNISIVKRGAAALFGLVLAITLVLQAPIASAASVGVLGLGDSTTAGYGLGDLSGCGRSSDAYSIRLAWLRNKATAQNLSCAGAMVPNVGDQIAIAKSNAVKPTVVTLGIGANDIGWSDLINRCMQYTDCGGTATRQLFNGRLATYKANLPGLYGRINRDLAPQKIAAIGYYRLFGANVSCAASYGITASEATQFNTWTAQLNSTIQSVVATVPNAVFVPIDLWSDKGICDSYGDAYIIKPPKTAWGHPGLELHKVIADRVNAKLL